MTDLNYIEDIYKFLDEYGMFECSSRPELGSLSEFEEMLAMQQVAVPDPEVQPAMEQVAAPEPQVSPLMQQEASSELNVSSPMQQEASPELNVSPPMQQEVAPENEVPSPMQQEAAPVLNVPPPMQQEVAPENEVPSPMQQEAAPVLKAAPWTPISVGVPIKQLLEELPLTVTVVVPNEKPINYTYTNTFNLILVKPDKPFTLKFSYGRLPGFEQMYLRSTLAFDDPSQTQTRVETCRFHYDQLRPAKGCEVLAKSVLHSYNTGPEVYQCGEPDNPNTWFSVVVPATGCEVQHTYVMKCRNSCFKNMSYRKTKIIFTLEDKWGKMYAQQNMGLQSCSSPFRDLKDMLEKCQRGPKRAQTPSTRNSRRKRPRIQTIESESTNLSPAESASTNSSPTESEATDSEPTEQQRVDPQPTELRIVESPLPDDILNSASVTLASMECLTDIVSGYGNGDLRVQESCRRIKAELGKLSEILPP